MTTGKSMRVSCYLPLLFLIVAVMMLQSGCVRASLNFAGDAVELVDCDLNNLFLEPGNTANCTCKLKEDNEFVDKVSWISATSSNETESGDRNATIQIAYVDLNMYREIVYCNVTNGSDTAEVEEFSVKMAFGPKDISITFDNTISSNAVGRCESTVNVTVNCDLGNVPVPNVTATLTADGTDYTSPTITNTQRDMAFEITTDHQGEMNVTCKVENGLFSSMTHTESATLTIHTPPTNVAVSVTQDSDVTQMGTGGADNVTLTLGQSATVQCEPTGQYPSETAVTIECGANHTVTTTGSSAVTLSIASVDDSLNGTECQCNVTHTSNCGTQTITFTINTENHAAPMAAVGGLFMAAALVVAMWAGSGVETFY